uniref:Dihydrolipoyl dehydrogenase n=1 Tax=Mucochytrium quahogii TaxID=96639 RepID=A0A7S2RSC7_9STRA|mmetsp:Transcript_9030/g.14683  ORF Transcript_9030/g.14683 Transcript_9030/m.14683 type:complete len:503 (+) Transcript_9030:47-1555(+)|eukprot:CAMPEP_0203758012 /NCGR_PEP_ID=MMETSP0098-20131031/10806_1 /ASSEMBLY_ACC=CAM_ASM_000208 /TAXON_ID=96639 /ORGANISM=" , Strain NY0313808BC1" /LENGTH=502 /DNA_ID=CAMNT_0050650259 /DNA_START=446 /DNA_END=1954 /DNA_ORIENTATION=+
MFGLVKFGGSAVRAQSVQKRVIGGQAARFFSSNTDEYDLVVIGAGPGGYPAAIKAGQAGMKVACLDFRGSLGGTCLNVGCIPSKALLESTHHYYALTHEFDKHGINVQGASVNLDRMMENKSEVVTGLTKGIEGLFKKNKVDWVQGRGKIIGANEVSVTMNDGGNQTLRTKNILIATGSEPAPLPPCPVDNAAKKIVDSTGILDMDRIPEKLTVVGGGVIGLEMGSVWARLGSEVTVVEYMDHLCPGMDKELIKTMERTLKKQGFKFKLKTKVVASEVTDSGVELTVEPSAGGEPEKIQTDCVIVSTGRRPYTEGLGLDAVGIPTDKMGRVEVDDYFRTNIPSIFAIGDCIQGPMLAHKAEEEGIAAVECIQGFKPHVNYNAIPGVIYTFPEVASVGKTEEQLKEEGIKFKKGKFSFMANSRARAILETEGFVKILADAETDELLGVHVIGPNAGEMIAEATLAIEYGASSEDLARTCHAHPTLSEALKEAAMATHGKPIHS